MKGSADVIYTGFCRVNKAAWRLGSATRRDTTRTPHAAWPSYSAASTMSFSHSTGTDDRWNVAMKCIHSLVSRLYTLFDGWKVMLPRH